MKRLTRTAILVATTSLAFGSAFAQTINTTAEGNGELRLGGRTYDLDRAMVILKENGKFDIAVYSRNNVWRFVGRHSDNGTYRHTLRIDDSSMGNASGGGTIYTTTRRRLERIDMDGTGRSGSFSIDFRTDYINDRPGYPGTGSGGNGSISDSIIGEGTYRVGNSTLRLRSANVRLQNGGKAEITVGLVNGGSRSFSGRWFDRRNDRIDIMIDNGTGGTTEGRGQIILRGNQDVFRIELDGRTNRSNFELRFQQSDSNDWNDEVDRNAFRDSDNGDGRIQIGDGRGDLNWASVNFERNGDAEIRLRGSKEYVLRGRWSKTVLGYTVSIDRGLDRTDTTGRGTVTVSNGQLRRISLSGTTRRERFSVNWTNN